MTLELREIGKRFGSLVVLDGVSCTVADGEAVGIVGPNGAGKTTLLDIIAGAQRAERGGVLLDGADVGRLAPPRRCRRGIARTFQTPRPLGGLTVFETTLVAAFRGGGLRGRAAREVALGALRATDTMRLADAPSVTLRLLDRKRLELARALATRPRVLLLDEIAGGLTEAETGALVQTVRDVHASGVAVIWVEHIIRALVQVTPRLICLADGRVLADGPAAEVMERESVRAAYFGRSLR